MERGLVQIYTGEGKGKTTAALGLILRACGQGLRVFLGQFAKGMDYGELHALTRLGEQVTVRQYGRDCFIRREPTDEDIRLARAGFQEVSQVVTAAAHDLVVLDEIGIALHYRLITLAEVEGLLDRRPSTVELVLTGRKIPAALFARADLVTEMREIKHYFARGVQARRGIEF